ncbi:MAG: ABC transporter substrate-binding protein [Alphaproteobacteria bacterium]|nr:ABC transporter substrate-binding protein [Alphaproteobacteria bacterium]
MRHFLSFVLFLCAAAFAGNETELPLVVITQIVEHDALTKEKEGIIEALKDEGFIEGKTINLLFSNAQGSITTARQIAMDFASRHPKVAVAISTPSAQSMIQPMEQQNIPIVFAAISDPLEAKLVSVLEKRPENITGVSDGLPLKAQIELIQKMIPDAKTIGVIYNPGEANSAKAVEKLQTLAPQTGLSLALATTTKTADTMSTMASLIGKVQAIFIPNDNTAMASITGIVALGLENKLPIFTPDYDSVEQGVLAVRACPHSKMGYKAGQLVAKILKGEKASDLPIVTEHSLDLVINTKSAAGLGISIPEDLKKEAKLVA